MPFDDRGLDSEPLLTEPVLVALALAWPQDARPPAVAAFVRAACAVAATYSPVPGAMMEA